MRDEIVHSTFPVVPHYSFVLFVQPDFPLFFFFNDTAPPEIYPLSLPAPLPISWHPCAASYPAGWSRRVAAASRRRNLHRAALRGRAPNALLASGSGRSFPIRRPPRRLGFLPRSEEHTSELQSPCNLVCRLLLEK